VDFLNYSYLKKLSHSDDRYSRATLWPNCDLGVGRVSDESGNFQVVDMIDVTSEDAIEGIALDQMPEATFLGDENADSAPNDPAVQGKFLILDGLVRLLTSDIRFGDFVTEALLLVLKVVQCEAGSVLEVDHKTETLFFRAVVGQRSERLTNFTLPMGQGIVGHVAESKQPLVVEDIQDNKIHLKAVARTVGFDVHNLVAVPIVIRGKTFGVLELLNRMGGEKFSPEDQEKLNYFCEMFAKVVEIRLMVAWGNNVKDAQETPKEAKELGVAA
jgi:putative methionine-R-sulfoxide reductase with GAF domain